MLIKQKNLIPVWYYNYPRELSDQDKNKMINISLEFCRPSLPKGFKHKKLFISLTGFFLFLLIVLASLIIYNVQLANIQKKNLALLFYRALPFPVPRHRTLSFRDPKIYIDINNQTSLDDRSMSLDERYMYVDVLWFCLIWRYFRSHRKYS